MDGEISNLNPTALGSVLVGCALIACTSSSQTFVLSKPFELRVGETRRLDEARFSVTFVGVEFDGRCPAGATCIWQGDAAGKFKVKADGSTQSITLHTTVSPRAVEISGYAVSLISLTPYPRRDEKTRADTYVAHLFVS